MALFTMDFSPKFAVCDAPISLWNYTKEERLDLSATIGKRTQTPSKRRHAEAVPLGLLSSIQAIVAIRTGDMTYWGAGVPDFLRACRCSVSIDARDLPHIANGLRRIVSTQTSRGDTNMRKFILIAGFVLASATAQAGDRNLSLGGETTSAPAPAKTIDAPRTAEAPQAAETPKYVERPSVEPKAETTRPEAARSEVGRSAASYGQRMRHRPAGLQQRYGGRPQGAGAGGMSARRAAMMQRGACQHRPRFGFRARIIMALHRHGIYW
jgi:hypothetical protein